MGLFLCWRDDEGHVRFEHGVERLFVRRFKVVGEQRVWRVVLFARRLLRRVHAEVVVRVGDGGTRTHNAQRRRRHLDVAPVLDGLAVGEVREVRNGRRRRRGGRGVAGVLGSAHAPAQRADAAARAQEARRLAQRDVVRQVLEEVGVVLRLARPHHALRKRARRRGKPALAAHAYRAAPHRARCAAGGARREDDRLVLLAERLRAPRLPLAARALGEREGGVCAPDFRDGAVGRGARELHRLGLLRAEVRRRGFALLLLGKRRGAVQHDSRAGADLGGSLFQQTRRRGGSRALRVAEVQRLHRVGGRGRRFLAGVLSRVVVEGAVPIRPVLRPLLRRLSPFRQAQRDSRAASEGARLLFSPPRLFFRGLFLP